MCLNPEAVEAAMEIGAVVEETACRKARRGKDPILCPFYRLCHYQAQKVPAGIADVVFAAHEIMFKAPTAIGDDFGLVVIDESFWQKGLTGIGKSSRLIVDSLACELDEFPVRSRRDFKKHSSNTDQLYDLIWRMQNAFGKMPDGYVTRQPLIDAGLCPAELLSRSDCAIAEDLEWDRKIIDPELLPNSSDEHRKKAVEKFRFYGRLRKRVALWRALDTLINGNDDATGRLILETGRPRTAPSATSVYWVAKTSSTRFPTCPSSISMPPCRSSW